jgi:uncharacterized membrane protein
MRQARFNERGQVIVGLILATCFVALSSIGLALDSTSVWFHDQDAQTVSDAACRAAAMDMSGVQLQAGLLTGRSGAELDCRNTRQSNPVLCGYAKANGYDGAGLQRNAESNDVSWSLHASHAKTALSGTNYLNVKIEENVPLHFLSRITGARVTSITAQSSCPVGGLKKLELN